MSPRPASSVLLERGVTLVELVVAMVVISIAAAGTLQLIASTTRASADPMLLQQATAVAEAYLEEILLNAYYDPDLGAGGGVCPAVEASRDLFDNVCDYDGMDDQPPRDQFGTPVAGLAPYRVRVAIDTAAALGGLSGPAQVLRADVRVTHSDVVDLTLSGYRADY